MSSIVKFDKAPLSEVVCGVEFNAPDFSSIHFGLYWQTIRDRFPTPPLDKPPIGGIEIMASVPRLRRVWFESSDRKRFVQLQTDRFHYNWKGRSGGENYPHFESLYPCFEQEWNALQQWWLGLDTLPIQPKHYELTYLNQIDADFGWCSPEDTSKIFSFIDLSWTADLEGINRQDINLILTLPNEKGLLSINLNQVKRVEDDKLMLLLELTARSIDCRLGMKEWFNDAHNHIVKTFVALLNDSTRMNWGQHG